MSDPLFNEGDQVEGISAEDQREIMLEIEKVAGENRIAVSEGLFDFTARRNGALFPLLVNLVGVLLLAGGIASLMWLFRTGEQQLLESGRVVVTAESVLIEEIRRETEQQLAAKDGEINAIQARLQEIDAERSALAGNLEARVAQREAQLRQELDMELAAERQRLRALNLSEDEIESRLASFAEVKEREFGQRLDQFQRQAEAEQERLAQELNQREAEFNRSLTQASQERDALLRESAERLTALQQEFEAELAAGQAELSVAQAELSRLSREQEREALLRGQIRGLYQTATTALQQENFDMARARLRDLRTLLNEDSFLRVPSLREQRPIDLLLVDSLEALIRFQEQFGTAEAERRLSQGGLVVRVQELVDQATAAAQAGQTQQAVGFYRQALDVIPAISESYSFLGDADDQTTTTEITRLNEEAAQLIAQADAARTAGEYNVAMSRYGAVVRDYPRSRYRLEATEGMDATLAAVQSRNLTLQDSLTSSLAELESDRNALQEDLTGLRGELTLVREDIARREQEAAGLRASITTLQAQAPLAAAQIASVQGDLTRSEELLSAARTRVQQLEQTVASRDAALQSTEEELLIALNELAVARARAGTGTTADPEMLAEIERLQALEEEIRLASTQWEGYRMEVATLGAPGQSDDVQLLNARVSLERFLSDATMRRFFPDMSREIERFDAAFIASGRENALLDAADLIMDLTFAESSAERIGLVRQARSGAGAAYLDFLTELEDLLRSVQ